MSTETYAYFLTWTTYGTWLPGDTRGWRKKGAGPQVPRPLLERWCCQQMTGDTVLLALNDRDTVERACQEHCDVRGWTLLAASARTNHVHVVVLADAPPKKVRDQLKANCTRCLRSQAEPLSVEKTWTKGGDIEVLDLDDQLQAAVHYVTETQDRKGIENA